MTPPRASDRHPLRDAIEAYAADGTIVSLELEGDVRLTGVVLGCASEFLWLQRIDDGRRLDGHCVVAWTALREVSRDRLDAGIRALLAGQSPTPAPDPLPETWTELFQAAKEARTLLAVHDLDRDRFWVGRPRQVTSDAITLDEVLADGSARRGREVAVAEIARLILGSRYLDAVGFLEASFDERALLAPRRQVSRPGEILALLRESQRIAALVHLVPAGAPGWWSGAIVGLTDRLVVLRELAEDRLEFDGHVAFRLDRLATVARDQKSVARWRLLERRQQTAPPLEDLPPDLTALLQSFVGRPELVSLQDDDPSACFVGYLTSCDAGGDVRMRSVDVDGRGDGDFAMATEAVTIVEWDSAYLRSLVALGRLT